MPDSWRYICIFYDHFSSETSGVSLMNFTLEQVWFVAFDEENQDVAMILRTESAPDHLRVRSSYWMRVYGPQEREWQLEYPCASPITVLDADSLISFEVLDHEQKWVDEIQYTPVNSANMNQAKAQKRWEQVRKSAAKKELFSKQMQLAKERKSKERDKAQVVRPLQNRAVQCVASSFLGLRSGMTVTACALIDDCLRNAAQGKPTYSLKTWDTSMLLYLTSPKTYHVLRQVFTWPSTSSLYDHYGTRLQMIKTRVTNMSHLRETLLQVRDASAKLPQAVQYTLAIDAFSFRTFSAAKLTQEATRAPGNSSQDKQDEQLTNGFLFMLVPHDYRVPVKLLHLAPMPSGSYNQVIEKKSVLILNEAHRLGLHILCKATDGDPGVSALHEQFYSEHIEGRSSCYGHLITEIWQWLHADESAVTPHTIPISDPLHIWKNIRSNLISHPISLFPQSIATSITKIRQELNLGNALDDVSQVGKMRDIYALRLFRIENVIALLKEQDYTAAFLLLPFAAWALVVFDLDIDQQLRLFLCELAFQLLYTYMDQFGALQEAGVPQNPSESNTPRTFAKAHYVKRMLNTIAAFGAVLFFGGNKTRMDSLGTHLVENAIGIARSTSADPRYERILSTFAHNELRKEIALENGLTIHVQGRLNQGGCKLDHDCVEEARIQKPENWRVDTITALAQCMCNPEIAPAMTTEIEQFIKDLQSLTKDTPMKDQDVNPTANNGIMSRLLHFKSE